jgi:hypothetical protein
MKKFNKFHLLAILIMVFMGGTIARAATSPGLGAASTFGILASTYTNSGATVINGDL